MDSHLQGPTTGGFGSIVTSRGFAAKYSDPAQTKLLAEIETALDQSGVVDGNVLLEVIAANKVAFNGTGAGLTCRVVARDGTTTTNLVTTANLVPGTAGVFYTKQFYCVGGEKVYVDFTPGTTPTAGQGAIIVKLVGLGLP